ncbi:MAG: hypothetical protein P8013_05260 [Candidatus Sulfobium sp.]
MKKNCWEFKGCGRQPGGDRKKEGVCPTALMTIYDGINGGENGGRACWMIAGTRCEGKMQGTFAHKVQSCTECDFYRAVTDEEGQELKLPLEILEDMLCKLE